MYNSLVKSLLKNISTTDGEIDNKQQKYSVSDNFSIVELYVSDDKVSFRVSGDAYLTAMVKWLAGSIQKGESVQNISIEELVAKFAIPEYKLRNAVQIVELIEKIYER